MPVDYGDPSLGNFRLFLVRRRANDQDDKIGSLLVNPGGPGASGASFAAQRRLPFGTELLDRFDIVGWDPRGTYDTQPAIDCIDDYDKYLAGVDITPDTPEAAPAATSTWPSEFEDLCVAEERPDPPARRHQRLGARHGLDPPGARRGQDQLLRLQLRQRARGDVGDAVPRHRAGRRPRRRQGPERRRPRLGRASSASASSTRSTCTSTTAPRTPTARSTTTGHAAEAFDELMADIDAHPLPTRPAGPTSPAAWRCRPWRWRCTTTPSWDQLSDALADAQRGDGDGLLILYDTYFNRKPDGTWPNLLEAFQVICCMDSADRPTIEEYDANALEISRLAPRFSPDTVGSYDCAWFPPTEHPRIPITGGRRRTDRGRRHDRRPGDAARRHRGDGGRAEDGRLVVVDADQHTGYGTNHCVVDIVHEYLIDLEVPPARTDC